MFLMNYKLIPYVIIVVLTVLSYYFYSSSSKKQKEIDILNINQTALLSDIETYKTKNGELVSVVNGFTSDMSTFKRINDSLYRQVSDLKLKLKNVSSIVEIREVIKYVNIDTISGKPINDSIRLFKIDKPEIRLKISILKDSIILPNNLDLYIPNKSAIVLEEARYKGWWFWRKLVGAKMSIINSNIYIEVQEAQYFNFK